MTYTSAYNSRPAMDYTPGYFELTCILKEGNITVTTSGVFVEEGEVMRNTAALVSEISENDYVKLSTDTGNTYSATGGIPVVTTVDSNGDCIIGKVLAEPFWATMPSASQTTWATMLAGKYYRMAKVGLYCARLESTLTADAATGTAITPGNSVIYDLSSNSYVYGRPGLLYTNNAVWDASGDDTGANGFLSEPIALHYSASDTGYIMIAHALIPVRVQT